ncbi:esterase [Tieghemostelium lacteum]|uniref:Esterase n=1 Tax=Tieghemostelium lacteum TaxID=361077 RepID=A0A151Z8C9_TIELA|nr:esterase [Tieghemostelium lacteum]|eukprot:KYQ90226.1 esterase [Tieghemostelium lacteum]
MEYCLKFSLLILLIIVSIVDCELLITPNNEYLYYSGRIDKSNNDCYVYSWSGVEILFTITGSTSVNAIFASDSQGEGNWVNIVMNQFLQIPINVTSGNVTDQYNLVSDQTLDPTQSYTINLIKRNEPMVGNLYFYGLVVDDTAILQYTMVPKYRKIEVLGDSITAAYGILGNPPCNFSPDTQDYYVSYGQMVANALNAQVQSEAWSGLGIVRNYGSPNITANNTFPDYYPYVNPISPENYGHQLYNFAEFQPDMILMNLGDNDYSSLPAVPQQLFESSFIQFINSIKSYYSKEPVIFMACGPMISQEMPGSPCCQYIQNVAAATNSIYIDLLDIQTEPTDFGCDGHPSISAHFKMAERVLPYIRKYMNWWF